VAEIVLHHHLGLGDHFICNGLVHSLLDQHDVVYLPAKRHYLETIRCLYSEEPRVHVFPVDVEHRDVAAFATRQGCETIRVGHEHCDPWQFDVSFYRQLNIPFEHRYTRFRLPRVIPHEEELCRRLAPRGEYCVVHREGSHGIFELKIDTTLPRVEIRRGLDPFGNLLGFHKLICEATQIHCINSSVLHLVDSISPRGRLFYHAVRRTDFNLRPCWSLVPYAANPVIGTWRRAVARARLLRARASR
jgi:hypothetical protein